MASIRDVAKKAGVGIGTVSRMLNNSGYISEKTRQKITMAINELKFIPNQLARNLSTHRNGMVAIIVPHIAHPFFAEFIRNAEMELYMRGYKTVICDTTSKSDREKEFLRMLQSHAVDGIITGSHSLDIEDYLKIKEPIIALERNLGNGILVVHGDHIKGGHLAAQKLLDCGCTQIAQFTSSGTILMPSDSWHWAFSQHLKKHGLNVLDLPNNSRNRFDFPFHLEMANKLFNEHPHVDGVFGADLFACAALKVAHQRGIPVPEKLRIIGYDGTYITDASPQTITAVIQPIHDLARNAVSTIIDKIEKKPILTDEIILDVYLKEGDTT
jgi:LacI family sucrose operon transcriptional repressor